MDIEKRNYNEKDAAVLLGLADEKERIAKWETENPINQDADKLLLVIIEQISKLLHDGHGVPIKRISHEALSGLSGITDDLKDMYDALSKLSVSPSTM